MKIGHSVRTRSMALLLGLALPILCGHVHAQYPDRIIKGIVPFPAGGGTRLPIDLFTVQNNLDMAVIPYRGAGDALTALLGGEADFMTVNAPALTPHIISGKLRALATTAPRRQPELPDVPTTREAGMPDYTYGSFFAVYVRGGTPAEIVVKLNSTLNAITSIPEVAARFRDLGAVATQKTPEESNSRYLGDIARFKDIVVRARIPMLD